MSERNAFHMTLCAPPSADDPWLLAVFQNDDVLAICFKSEAAKAAMLNKELELQRGYASREKARTRKSSNGS